MSGILPPTAGHVGVGEILAGAEGAPGAGEHQHARGLVGLDAVERVTQLGVHLAGEAVQLVGAVQGQAGDARLDCELDVGVFHERLLRRDSGAGRRGSGWRRRPNPSTRRWPPGCRRCRGSRRGRRLVHEHAAGEVDRQGDLAAPGGFGHGVDDVLLVE
jgi:hypothetical protein